MANLISPKQAGAKTSPLVGHEISEENRTRIIDWMVQVFRVLRLSSPETLFLAVTILDKYLQGKH